MSYTTTFENYMGLANVLDYGAVGDGVTDDSAAIQAAINSGNPVLLPVINDSQTIYAIGTDLTIPDGCVITAHSGLSYSTTIDSLVVLRNIGCTNTVIDLSGARGFLLEGFCVDGVDRSVDGITAVSQDCNLGIIRGVTVRYSNTGIGGTSSSYYMRSTKIISSTVTENITGIRDIIDSLIDSGTVIAGNTGNGISLSSGCNDNIIMPVKIEWSHGYGLNATSAENCVFKPGVVDANEEGGIRLFDCANWSVGAFVARRNGEDGATGKRSHVIIEGSTSNIQFYGISTKVGEDDGGGGVTRPDYSIEFVASTGTGLSFVNCDLQGAVTNPTVGTAPDDTTFIACKGVDQTLAEDDLKVSEGKLFQSNDFNSGIATGVTDTLSLTAYPVNTYTNKLAQMHVWVRNTSTGSDDMASFNILFGRESGDASISASDAFGEIGGAGSIGITSGGSVCDLSFTNIATDGSTFDVSVTNNTANTIQVFIEIV